MAVLGSAEVCKRWLALTDPCQVPLPTAKPGEWWCYRDEVFHLDWSDRGDRSMVKLFGEELSRREVATRSGALSQFAGVRLMELGDGVERGIRLLEFRTGTGLCFTVLIDPALDIADCEFKGHAIGWHSPIDFRHRGLHEYEGEGGLACSARSRACW